MPGVMQPDGTCGMLAREQYGGGDAEDLVGPPTDPARMMPSQRPPAPGKNLTSNISDQ